MPYFIRHPRHQVAPHLLVDCLETKAFAIADENGFEAPVQVVWCRPVGNHVVHAALVEFALEAIVILDMDGAPRGAVRPPPRRSATT